MKLLCTDSNIHPDYGNTRLSSSTLSGDAVKLAAVETRILCTGMRSTNKPAISFYNHRLS